MASYKINFARIHNCPDVETLSSALESFGLPENEPSGVLHCKNSDVGVFADIVLLESLAVKQLDREKQEVVETSVEKATVYPIGIFPKRGLVEIYDGGAAGIEDVGMFLAGGLGIPTVLEPIEIDLNSAIETLREKTHHFQLKKLRASEYAHNSYASGPYTPAFLDTEHGKEFLEEYAETMAAATVRFQMDCGKASLHLGTKACFRFTVKDEQDKPKMHPLLRELL